MQIFNVPIKYKDTQVSPFSLDSEEGYLRWRDQKLAQYPVNASALVVRIVDPFHISEAEHVAICDRVRLCNMALYQLDAENNDKELVRVIGKQFGLQRLDSNLCADDDSVSSLQVIPNGRQQGYIPYSNMKLSWHTDGYYNLPEETIRAFVLHCARPAAEGGENYLLDHEIAYIHLRDENPAYISVLMQPDVMTIPPNIENGVEIRGAQTGPVFSIDESTGSLHMRYTHRMRNIEWKQDDATQAAVACLRELLASDSPYIFEHRLQAGQGLICNNVLHSRAAFNDDETEGQTRLLYRARYFDRITNS